MDGWMYVRRVHVLIIENGSSFQNAIEFLKAKGEVI